MKSRTLFFSVIGLLILGIALFTFWMRNQEPAQVFPATVNRDCAPWDGGAFTISIQYDPVTTITISIWKSPDIKFPSTFSLPDETGQVGHAYLVSEVGPVVQLNGDVSFQHIEEGMPIEGRFSFTSERGGQLEGRFVAEWGSQIVMCG